MSVLSFLYKVLPPIKDYGKSSGICISTQVHIFDDKNDKLSVFLFGCLKEHLIDQPILMTAVCKPVFERVQARAFTLARNQALNLLEDRYLNDFSS